jgi:hypothetical protein
METVTDRDIRLSFVNLSKGETQRLHLPKDEIRWENLDFLGWRDPGAPERAYLVAERDRGLIGVALRTTSGRSRNFLARSMCSLCLTTHTTGGVALMTARRPGEAGRQGNSVGQYLCTDLACSLYIRGLKHPGAGPDLDETISQHDKIARTLANLDAFLSQILGTAARQTR